MRDYATINVEQAVSETDAFTEDRYRQFYRFMPRSTRSILDLGCNTGRGGRVLKELNECYEITGLDAVEERLRQLPEGVYETCIHGLSMKIPVDDGRFDVVLAGEFIEHLYPEDVDRTLAEVFRVLRVGGCLLLTTPNPGDLKRRIRGQSVLGGAHVSQHHDDALKMKLRMIGFSRVRILGSGKVSRYLGYRFPLLAVYGSYLAIGMKF